MRKENTIEVRTMTFKEVVLHWAKQSKILIDSVEKLFKDRFTSMEAIKLIDGDNLGKTKITRWQQKLILASVNKCLDLQKREVINGLRSSSRLLTSRKPQIRTKLNRRMRMSSLPTNQRPPEAEAETTTRWRPP